MRLPELLLAAVLCALVPATAPAAGDAFPSRHAIDQAAQEAKRHPDLGGKHMEKRLRLKQPERREPDAQDSLRWLVELARWFSDVGRFLVWGIGIVVVALTVVGVWRWLGWRRTTSRGAAMAAPSHVQSLDIRPESLPEDIGASAADLWRSQQPRAALSLLYRGALSRLVHVHSLPVAAGSTEGECLQLARERLDAPRTAFFARLVGAWQLAVYGARLPDTPQVLALCEEFRGQFGARSSGAGA